ncbi:eisosome protein SEG2-like [Lolium rigidum]|uniref:eisosome protein SEG2-like n=1 Tax=Lolium rigidum TaxID=89674 RepID=UPI001F5D23E7|nr:eisosome protein SEG2-like [Lolium rigidum]
MKDVLDGQPELIRRFNVFLPIHCQIELKKPDEDDGEQSGNDEDHDKQSGNDEDGDKQGRNDVDGKSRSDGPDNEHHGCNGDDDDEQTGRDVETTNYQVQKPLGRAQATSQGPRLRHSPPDLGVVETSQPVYFRWSSTFDDVPHHKDG